MPEFVNYVGKEDDLYEVHVIRNGTKRIGCNSDWEKIREKRSGGNELFVASAAKEYTDTNQYVNY